MIVLLAKTVPEWDTLLLSSRSFFGKSLTSDLDRKGLFNQNIPSYLNCLSSATNSTGRILRLVSYTFLDSEPVIEIQQRTSLDVFECGIVSGNLEQWMLSIQREPVLLKAYSDFFKVEGLCLDTPATLARLLPKPKST